MRREAVHSSVIAAIGYDERRQLLEIVFHTRRVYAYSGVPPSVHRELLAAPSIGSHFNRHVRDRYACTRLPDA